MKSLNQHLRALLMRLLLSTALIGRATAAIIGLTEEDTNKLKNQFTLEETAISSLFVLTGALGFSPGESLGFSGTFTESSWSLAVNGAYQGMPVDLAFDGQFNAGSNAGTLTSTGTVGALPWTGAGSWSFTDVDPQNLQMDWSSQATIGGMPPISVGVGPKVFNAIDGDSVGEPGFIIFTDFAIFRVGDGPGVVQESKGKLRITAPPRVGVILFSLGDQVILTDTFNLDSGTVAGTLRTVPEPSTFLLFGAGLISIVSRAVTGGRGSANRAT